MLRKWIAFFICFIILLFSCKKDAKHDEQTTDIIDKKNIEEKLVDNKKLFYEQIKLLYKSNKYSVKNDGEILVFYSDKTVKNSDANEEWNENSRFEINFKKNSLKIGVLYNTQYLKIDNVVKINDNEFNLLQNGVDIPIKIYFDTKKSIIKTNFYGFNGDLTVFHPDISNVDLIILSNESDIKSDDINYFFNSFRNYILIESIDGLGNILIGSTLIIPSINIDLKIFKKQDFFNNKNLINYFQSDYIKYFLFNVDKNDFIFSDSSVVVKNDIIFRQNFSLKETLDKEQLEGVLSNQIKWISNEKRTKLLSCYNLDGEIYRLKDNITQEDIEELSEISEIIQKSDIIEIGIADK